MRWIEFFSGVATILGGFAIPNPLISFPVVIIGFSLTIHSSWKELVKWRNSPSGTGWLPLLGNRIIPFPEAAQWLYNSSSQRLRDTINGFGHGVTVEGYWDSAILEVAKMGMVTVRRRLKPELIWEPVAKDDLVDSHSHRGGEYGIRLKDVRKVLNYYNSDD